METKKKPIQIYLREDQVAALRSVAERRGELMAALVREGVDLLLEGLAAGRGPVARPGWLVRFRRLRPGRKARPVPGGNDHEREQR